MYQTIQTADVDGKPGSELIARGVYGMRAWAWSAAQSTWVRPLPVRQLPAFTGARGGCVHGAEHVPRHPGRDRPRRSSRIRTRRRTRRTLGQYQSSLAGHLHERDLREPTDLRALYAAVRKRRPPSGMDQRDERDHRGALLGSAGGLLLQRGRLRAAEPVRRRVRRVPRDRRRPPARRGPRARASTPTTSTSSPTWSTRSGS